MRWAFWGLAVRQAIGLFTSMALARVLTPSDFGVVTMMAAITGAVMLAADFGLTWTLVQQRDIDSRGFSDMFWIVAGLGLLAFVVCWLLGPLAAAYYRAPELSLIAVVSGFGILLTNLAIVPLAVLRRRMNQRTITTILVVSAIAGQACALLIALLNGGYWALVAQATLPPAVVLAGAMFASGFRPTASFPRRCVTPMIATGAAFALVNVMNFSQGSVAAFVIGRVGTSADVGALSRAQFLSALPLIYFVAAMHDVMIPAMSAVRDDPIRLASVYRGALSKVARFACPSAAAIGLFAPEVVRILLGSQWNEAVPMVRWMALAGAAMPLSATSAWILVACNRRRAAVTISLVALAVTILAGVLGSLGGPIWVVALTACTTAVIVAPFALTIAHRAAGLPLGSSAVAVREGVVSAALLAAFGAGPAAVALALHSNAATTIVAKGLGCFAGLMLWHWARRRGPG